MIVSGKNRHFKSTEKLPVVSGIKRLFKAAISSGKKKYLK